jgi:hypothetical protein
MKYPKLILATATIGVLGAFALIPIGALAADAATNREAALATKLAAKLGIDVAKVQTALTDVHSELHAERTAEFKAELKAAQTAGKLTARQVELLTAVMEIKPEVREDVLITKEEMQNLTEAQRQAKMGEMRTQMEQKLIDALKAKGITTTADELKSANEAARTAGVHGGMMGGHRRGGMRP